MSNEKITNRSSHTAKPSRLKNSFTDISAALLNWQSENLSKDIHQLQLEETLKSKFVSKVLEITEELKDTGASTNKSVLKLAQIALDEISDSIDRELNSTHDPLTGLLNREGLKKFSSKRMLAYAHRHDRSVGIFFLDLNKFKPINDTLGHDEGDRALKLVAKNLSNALRQEDIIARWGGDEFIIMIMAENLNHNWQVTHDKIKGIFDSRMTLNGKDGNDYHIGSSIGFAIIKENELPEDAIKRADIEMYKVKKGIAFANPDLLTNPAQQSLDLSK